MSTSSAKIFFEYTVDILEQKIWDIENHWLALASDPKQVDVLRCRIEQLQAAIAVLREEQHSPTLPTRYTLLAKHFEIAKS